MRTLVFEFRIVSYEYFMNEMGISDAYLCVDNIQWTDYSFRTIMRYHIWSLYNSNGMYKNKNEINDIMSLPWDEKQKTHRVATESELKEQQNVMKQMEEMMKSSEVIEEKFTM